MSTHAAPYLVSRPPSPRAHRDPHTILCVDDSADILAMLRLFLGHAGYHVLTSGDANSALEHFMLGEVSLVVLDYDMPTANGVELARLFRRIDPDIPLLMFSGSVLADSETALLDGFVPKGAAGCDLLLKAIRAGLAPRP
ncbi:MAG: response regulator [Candidatus Koribacter versatilis]|uniref:Response regulator n=1 Tax=Candidatus Korobacter versatilis TaxID=658062 RepID=A0A932A9X7_9BACT|nr:response regulator [Candidatus Koribacter versatilis]